MTHDERQEGAPPGPGGEPDGDPRFHQAALNAAQTLLVQYGADAEVVAMMRAAEMAAEGDMDAWAHWERVLAALGALAAGARH